SAQPGKEFSMRDEQWSGGSEEKEERNTIDGFYTAKKLRGEKRRRLTIHAPTRKKSRPGRPSPTKRNKKSNLGGSKK
ncbi:hypothetical protein, partial [Leptospira borgpetersenii]|uniref:hypothetical protein n=1 Tax=Leptospira borgpetersenii TaxID=174 RepID=UPI0027DD6071